MWKSCFSRWWHASEAEWTLDPRTGRDWWQWKRAGCGFHCFFCFPNVSISLRRVSVQDVCQARASHYQRHARHDVEESLELIIYPLSIPIFCTQDLCEIIWALCVLEHFNPEARTCFLKPVLRITEATPSSSHPLHPTSSCASGVPLFQPCWSLEQGSNKSLDAIRVIYSGICNAKEIFSILLKACKCAAFFLLLAKKTI